MEPISFEKYYQNKLNEMEASIKRTIIRHLETDVCVEASQNFIVDFRYENNKTLMKVFISSPYLTKKEDIIHFVEVVSKKSIQTLEMVSKCSRLFKLNYINFHSDMNCFKIEIDEEEARRRRFYNSLIDYLNKED